MMMRQGRRESAEQGSMLMALLVTVVGMALTAALVPIVIGQITSTRTISGRTQALAAAQAGIDVALGQLRAAVVGNAAALLAADANAATGVLEALPPCAMSGIPALSNASYRVTISYFAMTDPARPTLLLPLSCPPIVVPYSATLTSTGGGAGVGSLSAGSAGTRTISATYTFKTTNAKYLGGAIPLATPVLNPLCLDGGASASPPAGTHVTVQLCPPEGISSQRFAYTDDLNLKLVGSEAFGAQYGMCLQAPTPHSTGGLVTFQPCLGRVASQQWSLNDRSEFEGTTDGSNNDNFCLNVKVANNNPGSDIVLGGCPPTSTTDPPVVNGKTNQVIFRPETAVGAGMASAVTQQLVNYEQYNRCLDVKGFDVSFAYMVVWFCKQAPDGVIAWNQTWTTPRLTTTAANATVGRIRTIDPSRGGYCLHSPGSTGSNQYITMAACSATGTLTDNKLKWILYGDTGTYATSYIIVDAYGYCLTATDLNVAVPDAQADGTAKAKVDTCNGSELQKWNAPPNFNNPLVLTNIAEK